MEGYDIVHPPLWAVALMQDLMDTYKGERLPNHDTDTHRGVILSAYGDELVTDKEKAVLLFYFSSLG